MCAVREVWPRLQIQECVSFPAAALMPAVLHCYLPPVQLTLTSALQPPRRQQHVAVDSARRGRRDPQAGAADEDAARAPAARQPLERPCLSPARSAAGKPRAGGTLRQAGQARLRSPRAGRRTAVADAADAGPLAVARAVVAAATRIQPRTPSYPRRRLAPSLANRSVCVRPSVRAQHTTSSFSVRAKDFLQPGAHTESPEDLMLAYSVLAPRPPPVRRMVAHA